MHLGSPWAKGFSASPSAAKLLALEHLAALLAAETALGCTPTLLGAEERNRLSFWPSSVTSLAFTTAAAEVRAVDTAPRAASSRMKLESESLAWLRESWSPPSVLLVAPALLRALLRMRGHVWSSNAEDRFGRT